MINAIGFCAGKFHALKNGRRKMQRFDYIVSCETIAVLNKIFQKGE